VDRNPKAKNISKFSVQVGDKMGKSLNNFKNRKINQ
jgi:hypothetical protein